MANVTFVTHDGENHEATLIEGTSLMRVAVDNAVPGIDGDCGGEAACGTCHVIVENGWTDVVGANDEVEEDMLAMNPEREPTSRLSCQMTARENWDGLTVRIPEFQL
ncbi:Ferredoxin [Rhodococcus sp. AW25M09]|uniref:2Fe-2S iron-sulfur cluster-binding protein n=1 Tax=Rhodococcus sp. AW25M09 TaxID=1268303 RepID=UPI0002AD0A30|nr:2Fe-2S iron-sulfur cluster-binding protein [Rhodococcus sp. AW25M09]CCQ13997.1 Ferredoxin [Rhodococcus sp. AW25M09]